MTERKYLHVNLDSYTRRFPRKVGDMAFKVDDNFKAVAVKATDRDVTYCKMIGTTLLVPLADLPKTRRKRLVIGIIKKGDVWGLLFYSPNNKEAFTLAIAKV